MPRNAEQEYAARKAEAERDYVRWATWSGRLRTAAFLIVAGFLLSLVHEIKRSGNLIPLAAELAALALAGGVLLVFRGRGRRAMRVVVLYERALNRVSGRNVQSGHTGEAFAAARHLYARDLDVLGPNSLFGMLAITRTALGQAVLAEWLLAPAKIAEAAARQESVRELTRAVDLREQVALLGRSQFEDLPASSFADWLGARESGLPSWLRALLVLLAASWLLVLLSGLLLRLDQAMVLRNLVAILAVQGAVCLKFRQTVRAELESAERLEAHVGVLREGLAFLRRQQFESTQLRGLQTAAKDGDNALKRLERLLMLVEQRAKEWYYVPALLVGAGTHAAAGLQRWKRQHGEAMRVWLRAWSEFDALLALSGYAAEHPDNTYPVLLEGEADAKLIARELKHPLLPQDVAIGNDVALGDGAQVLLISGSNMAGKSTLLRAIGANAVLAWVGVPVPAASMVLNTVCLGASLVLSDSLAEGRSKFLAEVERLSAIVSLAETHRGRTLFLIDEIFSGTNSLDRKAAAEAVVRALAQAGAVGAVSTHDLTLTEIAALTEAKARNVHMASPDENDPLAFDYKLKDGANQTTNALAIVRMLGLMKQRTVG